MSNIPEQDMSDDIPRLSISEDELNESLNKLSEELVDDSSPSFMMTVDSLGGQDDHDITDEANGKTKL